jgi:hypothetical protein
MFSKTTATAKKYTSLKEVINFGKYKGKTLQKVLDIDASYLQWAIRNTGRFSLSKNDIKLISQKADEEHKDWLYDNYGIEDGEDDDWGDREDVNFDQIMRNELTRIKNYGN